MDFKSPFPYIHTTSKYVSSSSNISRCIWCSITCITLDYLRAKHKLQNILQLWNEVTFSSKWLEWILALFAQNFSVFRWKKFLMEIKFFCCHPLLQQLHASLATSSKKRNLAARFKKQRVQDSFMLGCCGWVPGMGMSSTMFRISQAWLWEPGLGKISKTQWQYHRVPYN